MMDENFQRTVVLLVEHNDEGSLGFVLNRIIQTPIQEVVQGMPSFNANVMLGGPVEQNTLHYVHKVHDLSGAQHVFGDLYWSGDFDELVDRISSGDLSDEDIIFFVGYSGWGPGQLEFEMQRKSWIVAPENIEHIFRRSYEGLWQDILRSLGKKYQIISNYPMDPRLN